MAPQYGEVRVDYITYTTGVSPNEANVTVLVSGLVNNPTFSGNVIIEGNTTIDGDLTVSGSINASGVIISGITGLFDDGTEALPSIAFASDPDTGIYKPATNEIGISTSGLEALRIDNTGNVGIGTSSPSKALEIKSSAPIIRLTEDTNTYSEVSANSSILSFKADEGNGASTTRIDFRVDGSERMRIDSSGHLLLGTTTAGFTSYGDNFTIGDSSHCGMTIRGGTTSDCEIFFADGTTGTSRYSGGIRYAHNTDHMQFTVNASERMRIDSSGNVIVGGTSTSSTNAAYISPNGTFVSNRTVASNDLWNGKLNGAVTSTINADGSATFGQAVNSTGNNGILLGGNNGQLNLYTTRYSTDCFQILNTTGSGTNVAVRFDGDGSATFAGGVNINGSGRLLVGTSSSRQVGDRTHLIQIEGNSSNDGGVSMVRNFNDDNSTSFTLAKTRGTSVGSTTIVQNGDKIGEFAFAAADGSDVITRAALIRGDVDGTPGTNDMPGRLLFSTTASGASSPTERMRIDSSGRVGIGTTAPGNTFHVVSSGSAVARIESTATESNIRFKNSSADNAFFGTTAGDNFFWYSGGSERMRIDSSGRMLIGTTTAPGFAQADDFTVSRSTDAGITIRSGTAHSATLAFSDGTGGGASEYRGLIQYSHLSNSLAFSTNSAERLRIDSSGRLLVGTSSASTTATTLLLQGSPDGASGPSYLRLATGTSSPGSASTIGQISFTDSGHTTAASIVAFRDGGTWASGSSQPTKLVFSTTADGASSPTERMRIDSSGSLLLGRTSAYNSSPGEVAVFQGNRHGVVIFQGANANYTGLNIRNAYANNGGNNVSGNMITFHDNGGTERGKIAMNGSSTSYITSSDYRLKENVVNITDGITRIKQLLPKRFNFIVDANTTVDGFLAHEAQAVVPEAITGTKDEVDDDGNAVMQGIDQSKLVPLLTAALQEAITKIETLEQRLTDAGL